MSFSRDSSLVSAIAPSPNHGERKAGKRADAIILHYTGMPSAEAALALLCDPTSEVSCHYLVHEDGHVTQLVPEARRAWHSGRGVWRGETDMNSRSIGIEIAHPGHPGGRAQAAMAPYPRRQIAAVVALCADIRARHGVVPARVLAHSDIAPARKIDPGERFPWSTLHRHGLALWLRPGPPDGARGALAIGDRGPYVGELRRLLGTFGYGVPPGDIFDAELAVVVKAFQRRFRPACVDGVADRSTFSVLRRLLAAS
jgi:N-acetylmuramoyl-L-alanine amidase